MFLYLGATPNPFNIFITLAETALTVLLEEMIQEISTYTITLKEWMIMLVYFPVILLGTAEGLS